MNIIRIFNSSLFRSASVYTVTSAINSAIPFLLLPILTRYLTPGDYGIVTMFGVLVSLVTPFISLNTHGAITRMYYEKETINIKVYITNCLFLLMVSTLLVSLIFLLFSELISNVSSVPKQILWAVIAVSFGQFMTIIVLTLFQLQVKPGKYGVYQITQTMLNATLSLFFIVSLGMAWQGRILALLITFGIFSLLAIRVLWKNKWLEFKLNLPYIKNALKFGVPLIPHSIGAIIMTMTDRLFITNMVGIEITGVYAVGFQISAIISLLTDSFNRAYGPWLFEKLSKNVYADKVKIVKMTYAYFLIILIITTCLSLIAPWFLNFFIGKEYANSSVYVPWIAFGAAFGGMYYMVGQYIFYAQKTALLAGVTLISALLNVILSYFLIKKFGAIGAAQATTIVFFTQFILTWILSNKVYDMPWGLRRINKN